MLALISKCLLHIYKYIFFFSAEWPLDYIPLTHQGAPVVRVEKSTVPASPALSRMSSRQEHQTVDVPGVGEVPSAWIGQAGKRKMGKLLEQEELRPVIKGLQQELRHLASTCYKALMKFNAEDHADADVVAAVDLCKQFLSQRDIQRGCKEQRIAELWRTQQMQGEPSTHGESTTERATRAIGEKLVDVITEKSKQPPDVSKHLSVIVYKTCEVIYMCKKTFIDAYPLCIYKYLVLKY